MENKQRYDIETLEWQQFEILSFKCLQQDVSSSIYFIDGGSDKGRDFIFKGITSFFGIDNNEYNYIFQAKHKSNKNSFSVLNKDLEGELEKVYIKNGLYYDVYCLVTNLTLTGDQFDILEQTFNSFISKNRLSSKIKFKIYSYRNLEACIDKYDFLKWIFPSIIRNTDFKLLLEDILERNQRNISRGWLSVFERNKVNFVYTNVFEQALLKLEDNNVLLLSGSSKAGKTFNAEMLLFKSFCENSFTPFKVDKTEEFDKFYDESKKQIFLFDDAFGKYNIDLHRADSFNRKLEYIFELIDKNHKCIFTSRDYIYKAFLHYAESDVKKFITKINIEVSDLTKGEKESIFFRYYKTSSNIQVTITRKILDEIICHKNFSPETIRAYFANCNTFEQNNFIEHLNSPDEYLEKDFNNLSEEKKMVLISTLLSLNGSPKSISYSFNKVCDDLNKPLMVSLKDELTQLEGSILKNIDEEYLFYHPSMFEFFVIYIAKDISIYRILLLKNFNISLLNVIRFKPINNEHVIKIDENDLGLLMEGFNRLSSNPEITLNDFNSMLSWIYSNTDVQLNFKIQMKEKYSDFKSKIDCLLMQRDYLFFLNENIHSLADFFKIISFNNIEIKISDDFYEMLIKTHKNDPDYWLLVFSLLPLLDKDFIFKYIGKDWLNNFYLDIRKKINSLGFDLFGDAYPKFEEVEKYERLNAEKKFEEAHRITHKKRSDYRKNTNRDWYPRYIRSKEKMNVLKSSQPYGYKLYNLLMPNFSHLQRLEENQFNRYIFNKEKKWW